MSRICLLLIKVIFLILIFLAQTCGNLQNNGLKYLIIKWLTERTNGYITAKELRFRIRGILNITISVSRIQHYRHNVIKMNHRRSRFQPKIFSPDELNNRLIFAKNLRRLLTENQEEISKIMQSDETKLCTGIPGTYMNRIRSSRPKTSGYRPRKRVSINLWAGITTRGPTKPAVSNIKLIN